MEILLGGWHLALTTNVWVGQFARIDRLPTRATNALRHNSQGYWCVEN